MWFLKGYAECYQSKHRIAISSFISNNGYVLSIAFAFAATGFKNKSECMEYVIEDIYVVINHALKSAKVSKQLAEKLCAEY